MHILYLSFENATIQLFVLHGKSMLFEQPTSIRINFSLAFFFLYSLGGSSSVKLFTYETTEICTRMEMTGTGIPRIPSTSRVDRNSQRSPSAVTKFEGRP